MMVKLFTLCAMSSKRSEASLPQISTGWPTLVFMLPVKVTLRPSFSNW